MGGEQNQIGYARMKRLLVTGATSGIGEAVALLAAKNGYAVIACGRNKDKLAILEQQPKYRPANLMSPIYKQLKQL